MSQYGRTIVAMQGQIATFKYVNWRGDDHEYVIEVEGVARGAYDDGGINKGPTQTWVLHGHLVTRDGEKHDVGMRRTFMLNKIRDLKVSS